ncbi:uncharacterized protein LOC125655408 [Ostrea edulis]|uniref:uncharacterized protein LOC125655408 n=1 Tax=Ostrea edulis TaxID=37623 RepID=UPI0024AEE504|nr:uncharacterized protein LOC125655408 [Ostrea edulis]
MAAPTIDNIVEELLPDFGVNALKQKDIISNITKNKDCIAVLPTGFGKSLPFQVYAAAQKRTSREAGHVLVCSPLIGLMKDQTKKLSHISYLSVGYKVCDTMPFPNSVFGTFIIECTCLRLEEDDGRLN